MERNIFYDREDIKKYVNEFVSKYDYRPVAKNMGGMLAPHMIGTYYTLKKINPNHIIESGIWMGQGTWMIEKACPDTNLICIDPDMSRLVYKSPKAQYTTQDFSLKDWSFIEDKEDCVIFFDDHVDAMLRLRMAHSLGFKKIMFEDNYPIGEGDCHSFKKIIMEGKGDDFDFLENNVKSYNEFPPIFKKPMTRWGTPWEEPRYPTVDPIYNSPEENRFAKVLYDEAEWYTWICYIEMR